MTLVLDEVKVLETSGNPSVVDVTGVEHDSRRIQQGDLFCCVPGGTTDGHLFASDAVRRGAVGVLCEHLIPELEGSAVVQARVAPGTLRHAMALAAAAVHRHPSRSLLMCGVTGTNGKTTVTYLLGSILEEAGLDATVVGTLSGARTTPESTELQRLLAGIRETSLDKERRGGVAMEVSSHALVQSRVDGIEFDVAVFTNLSHDHLDYHGTMESYFEAKAMLFTSAHARRGVINVDDPWGRRLASLATIPVVEVSQSDVTEISIEVARTRFRWRDRAVQTALTGRLNVENAHLAAEAALAVGIDADTIVAGLAAARPVPGRLEVVRALAGRSIPFSVLVDYAHTPAALEAVLELSRELTAGSRVLLVFGCGGDRDRAKRPLMGEVATRLADRAFLTSDNPRDEDPLAIIDAVRAGALPSAEVDGRLVIEPDRRRAIERALAEASGGDVVLIAGKGHEDYQEIRGVREPFNDAAVAAELLAQRAESPTDATAKER
jgi:UDP-N-acetylmuramoyl-L-alanyl-D-glutamate--2,6-diaminopimelate ligase